MVDVEALIDGPDLYLTTLPDGQQYAWRLLSMKEYQVFAAMRANGVLHEYALYSQVFDRCYIGDAGLINGLLPAGIFISIGELIMWMSGDCTGRTDKDDFEAMKLSYPANALSEHMKHIVYAAFPSYTIEDVEGWSRPMLLKRFFIAEQVLLKRGIQNFTPMEVKNIESPADQAKKKKKPAIDFAKENAAINEHISSDREHILERNPDVLIRKMRQRSKIEAAEARKLDQIVKPR
jgi:hypothetical protein